jgi:hypothetical protein
MSKFEEDYLDVFQNIESAIVSVHQKYADLTDYDVDKALAALIQTYRNEAIGKAAVPPSGNLPALVYERIATLCEWRLGRSSLNNQKDKTHLITDPISIQEILLCLKRLRKSLETWNKQGGRQGYLNYIAQFL